MKLHEFLDVHYHQGAETELLRRLVDGADPNELAGYRQESALHVAARRRRLQAVEILVAHGAQLDLVNRGGKTAYVLALRRGFTEVAQFLEAKGCVTHVTPADQFALWVGRGEIQAAKDLLKKNPQLVRTGNLEEDRLLADLAGRDALDQVTFLVEAGADLTARGMDDGTPLHMAAWFGQEAVVAFLIQAGAPLEYFDCYHNSSPLGWAVHGARYSGGAPDAAAAYLGIVERLIQAGSRLRYPGPDAECAYAKRLLEDAPAAVKPILRAACEQQGISPPI